eukprot:5545487-Pleurochrysis_carterae.AAC.2
MQAHADTKVMTAQAVETRRFKKTRRNRRRQRGLGGTNGGTRGLPWTAKENKRAARVARGAWPTETVLKSISRRACVRVGRAWARGCVVRSPACAGPSPGSRGLKRGAPQAPRRSPANPDKQKERAGRRMCVREGAGGEASGETGSNVCGCRGVTHQEWSAGDWQSLETDNGQREKVIEKAKEGKGKEGAFGRTKPWRRGTRGPWRGAKRGRCSRVARLWLVLAHGCARGRREVAARVRRLDRARHRAERPRRVLAFA